MTAGSAVVHGFAITGAATARALLRHGYDVVAIDDVVTDDRSRAAASSGIELRATADVDLDEVMSAASLFSPSPGVPETHPTIDAARRHAVPIVSELELAYRWEQDRPGGPRPMLAITGTDGKTSTTQLAVSMLRAAGLRTEDVGNTDTPLVDVLDEDLDAYVIECSSFRLAWTPTFRADAAAWLNLQPDHLNWHRSLDSYEMAKAQIFANQRPEDVAIGFIADPVVMRNLDRAPGRHVTFGPGGDYRRDGDRLVGPGGPITDVASMRRALPHDVTNTLAAAALVIESGLLTGAPAGDGAIARAVSTFVGPPHRIESLGCHRGVEWINDSKATTPHAAGAALRSFDRIVLIAGGADKGVDLGAMAVDSDRIRAVLAIGETAPAIADVFAGSPTVEICGHLDRAVERAAELAEPGDTVLLSPGCASLDQFDNFEARGEEFRRLVAISTNRSNRPDGGVT